MNPNNLKGINQKKQGTYLWKVEGENAELYLNGTIHIVPKNFFPLKDEIMDSFNKCKNLIVEVTDLDINVNTIKITDDIINNKDYIYEDGDSLYNHFPKEQIIRLRKYFVNNDLCSPAIEKKFYKLKPFVINSLLFNMLFKKANLDQENIGLDFFFIRKAKEMNKNIMGLETKEFQEDLLNKVLNNTPMDKTNKTDITNETYNNSKIPNSEIFNIFDKGMYFKLKKFEAVSWFLKNCAKFVVKKYSMESNIKKEKIKTGAQKDILFDNREKEMFKKIENLLQNNDSYFVAVGAAHLLEDGSIIDRLDKKGYKATRIC